MSLVSHEDTLVKEREELFARLDILNSAGVGLRRPDSGTDLQLLVHGSSSTLNISRLTIGIVSGHVDDGLRDTEVPEPAGTGETV